MMAAIGFLLVALTLSACSSNGDTRSGTGEPFVIKVLSPSKTPVLAQFIPGKLPGSMPTDASTGTATSTALGGDAGAPQTLHATFHYSAGRVFQGQAEVAFDGTTSSDVSAVGLALQDLGTGYWVVPVGDLDVTTLLPSWKWNATADFGVGVPEGLRYVQYVAIDGSGNAGTIQSQRVCVASRVPDGYQGCVPNPKPPAAVISLSWDTNVDLDLQVVLPNGRLVEPKNAYTVDLDAGTTALPADAGYIDRDSNANCVIDNIRYENLVWQNTAPKGRYGIYVNLFDSCKQPVVHFNLQVYTAIDVSTGDGGTTKQLNSRYSADGILLDFQANGGSNVGFFVREYDF